PYTTHVFFHFITSADPRTARFPYTTLFRSAKAGSLTLVLDFEAPAPSRSVAEMKRELETLLKGTGLTFDWRLRGETSGQSFENLDRKSTRLNSSHGSISYAVFCLKQKNTRR